MYYNISIYLSFYFSIYLSIDLFTQLLIEQTVYFNKNASSLLTIYDVSCNVLTLIIVMPKSRRCMESLIPRKNHSMIMIMIF